jgi:hypothetical protein
MENAHVPQTVGDSVVIAYEGKATEDGRTILSGALYWEDLPLPVFAFEGEGLRNVVGKIVELERTDDGKVVALLSFDMPSGYALSLDGEDASISYEFETVLFSRLRVAGGTLIPRAAWAW